MRASRLLGVVLLAALCLTFDSVRTQEAAPRAAQPKDVLPGIVFVAAPIFDEKTDIDGAYQGSYHWRDGYVYARAATYHRAERTTGPVRPARNLFALAPANEDGELKQLTFLKTGAVFKPEPSFDGKKVLFSMRRDGEDWFNLYEINVDGSGLRQLTDGPFNDFAGAYLPDGRIVFTSDRTGYLEEYHEERTECLFVMSGDGTGIHQITFMPGTYFEPSVMRDGRILFAFWDAYHIDVPPLDKHETFLMTVNPDGTEERHLFGAGQYQYFQRERHSGVGLTQPREMPDGRILCQSEFGPSLIDLGRGLHPRDALTPIFPGCTSVQLGGTTHRVHLSPLGTKSTAYPLPDGRIIYSSSAPGARDSGIFVCDPNTREEKRVFNIPDYAEFDAVPVLVERPKPRRVPMQVKDPKHYASGCVWKTISPPSPLGGEGSGVRGNERETTSTTRFLVVAGRETDNPKRAEALKRARYFRVIEAEYTGVTTSSHTNLETRILGVVPIFDDGSAYFEAPADTPLFLDALDAAGNRVLHEWPHPNTSVPVGSLYPVTQMAYMSGRAGETKACYGCHAPQTNAVPNVSPEALRHGPVKITRESTDLQYRRNDPEAYRRQARVGEAEKYRSWLASKDPVLRARACELLMYTPDGVSQSRAALIKLLKDESVDVRRAAALALAFSSRDQALEATAEKDADWLARFNAQSALQKQELDEFHFQYQLWVEGETKLIPEARDRQRKEFWGKHLALEGAKPPPLVRFRLANNEAIPAIVPWLKRHEWEYHAAEAAMALSRIGTPEAVEALWAAFRSEVPNKQVVYARYLQHGPRPEEYAILKGLVIANAKPQAADVHLLIAMLPNTFMEKPRFEDRLREETQRVVMPRLLLERANYRKAMVETLVDVLNDRGAGTALQKSLREQILKGINLERPFSEHGRPFPVVKEIGPEEALWLLTSVASIGEVPEELIIPFLTSKNHRERIDAAVLLGLQGFGPKAAEALAAEIAKPYALTEISSIGKGMPDENFRDKAYMIQALAMHVEDVNRLKPFADPKTMYRDIRYGLTRGLARRGAADGIPLLIEMATNDPITLIRQQARYALADIQDAHRLVGKPVPEVKLPEPQPLEALYPPRGLEWKDQAPDPLPTAKLTSAPVPALTELLVAGNFRNLGVGFVRGADRMMVKHVAELDETYRQLHQTSSEAARKAVLNTLDTPYPHAHYQAAAALAANGYEPAIPVLRKKLDEFVKAGNMVGFWWCCDALGRLRAKEAIPDLVKLAIPTNPPNTFGPEGMVTGYIAAKSLAQIVADLKQADVAKLLTSDNIWLRAGALRGLAEAKAPGIEEILRQSTTPDMPALVKQESEVQLRRLFSDASQKRR